MSELIGRIGVGAVVLALAAAVVTMSGGTGLGGRLGALFGLHSAQDGKPLAAIDVAAPAAVRHAVASARLAGRPVTKPQATKRTRSHSAPAPDRVPVSGEAPRPAPAQQPAAPSPPPPAVPHPAPDPAPAPAPPGSVQKTVQTLHDTAAPIAPAAQPLLDQTVQTVNQACVVVGGCP